MIYLRCFTFHQSHIVIISEAATGGVLWKKVFLKFHRKASILESLLIRLQAWDLQLYWKETATQMLSCEICKVLKNTCFEEHLRATATVISKSWMHSSIQICLCQKGIRKIAPEEDCPSVRVSVWFRVSFRVGGQFSSGRIVLELSKELRFVFLKFDESMKLIISLLQYFTGATTGRKFPHNNMF